MEVIKGKTYKHYKGNFYKVIALTNAFKSSQSTSMTMVRDESTLEPLELHCNGEFCWLQTFEGELIKEEKVVYRNTQKVEHPWVRSFEKFQGKTDKGFQRFTLVNQESTTY